jgi:pullulanase
MKKLLALFTLLAASLALTGCVPESAESEREVSEDKVLIVHYLRYDSNYEPWNLWLWAEGQEGTVYEFTEEDDFGVVANAIIPNSKDSQSIGIIVRTNSWDKDVPEDRFITKFDEFNKAEVWLIQGESEIYYEKPATGPKILGASIDSLNELSISLNQKIELSNPAELDFKVTTEGKEVEISGFRSKFLNTNTSEFTIDLKDQLDLGASYQVESGVFGSRSLTPGLVFGSTAFEEQFHFDGELGAIYSKASTTLRVWAPTAKSVSALIYQGTDKPLKESVAMKKGPKGTWSLELAGDQHLTVYNYEVNFGNRKVEAVDPYVRSATVNGKRGVIVDLARTNPAGWPFTKAKFSGKPTDAVFYELHVRDLGMDESSGIKNKGKFISLTEAGTKTPSGDPTGIDAIVEMGATHLQLIPIYDYASIDETRNDQFNWGYDPLNYDVPEGSYSTDSTDPVLRIRELKEAIQYVNSRGMRVVMDVVYNHVYDVSSHSFQKIVPGYYFRTNKDGSFANGTGVGNETASERSMVRKFIVDSASYWAKEYRLGGFRFDLMGIHDVETMNQVRKATYAIDPTFLIIGEGWNMGSVLPQEQKANQLNAYLMPGISHFNDGIRDGIKGSVFDSKDTGWATGKASARNQVMAGIVGQIKYSDTIGGQWGNIAPGQSVSYVEAHDNLTLKDKLSASYGGSATEISRAHRFASSIALLAQGVSFIHAGQEFERSKDGDENSYKSSDRINSLKWQTRSQNSVTVQYFKGLIELRKNHPAFRMDTADKIRQNLKFFGPEQVIAYELNGAAVGDSYKRIIVIHNPAKSAVSVNLPAGSWEIAVQGDKASSGSLGKVNGKVSVEAVSTLVLFQR